VVDNGSADGSPEMVETEFPGVHVIRSTNRGFAAGSNLGLAASASRYVLLLNPDTEIASGTDEPSDEPGSADDPGSSEAGGDALTVLMDYMESHPTVGIAGPQLRYGDGHLQSSRRRFPTPLTGFFESTVLQQWFPRNRWAARYHMADVPEGREVEVDWLMGAALLVRRQAITGAGPLDEGYFMYSEEMEWCLRSRAQGWRAAYLPQATVIHYEGRSSEQVAARRDIYFQTSKLRYWRRTFGPAWAAALRSFLLATYVYQGAVEGAKWLLGHKRPLRAQRLAAYRQVLASGLRYKA
jgi:N-acetylglucosaminyl-diphospho-decaprenol L-rhamnosyltransferase